MTKSKGERFYRKGSKYRVHGYNKEGMFRILRWEDIPEDLREFEEDRKGEYRIVEYIINFIPTKGRGGVRLRRFEAVWQGVQGTPKHQILHDLSEAFADLTNDQCSGTSRIEWKKEGEDIIEYVEEEYRRLKIYSDDGITYYPLGKRGQWKYIGEDEE